MSWSQLIDDDGILSLTEKIILIYHSSAAMFLSSCKSRSWCIYIVVSYWSCCVWFCFRDLVHRQTACAAIKHMALGVYGFGCEDALIHLLNHVWPNIFETSPHLVQAFMDSIEGLRVALGPNKILQYVLQVSSTEIWVMC